MNCAAVRTYTSNLLPKTIAHRRTSSPKLTLIRCVHSTSTTIRKCNINKLWYLPRLQFNLCTKRYIFTTRFRLANPLKNAAPTITAGQSKSLFDLELKLKNDDRRTRSQNVVYYVLGSFVLIVGLTYVSVPAYRVFCQATSLGGTVRKRGHSLSSDENKLDSMTPVKSRLIKVSFEACTGGGMSWIFEPLQREIWVHPGETALAFFSAKNPTSSPIVGISTYNVLPYEAGRYFSKVQCFCFEEQLLNPGEQLDMPVFFYIDPDYASDPGLEHVDDIVLGYTFFESRDGITWPLPMPNTDGKTPLHFVRPGEKKTPVALDA